MFLFLEYGNFLEFYQHAGGTRVASPFPKSLVACDRDTSPMVMEVPGKRRRGRPNRRWLDNITNDLSERELSGEEAQYRVKWRRLIRHI